MHGGDCVYHVIHKTQELPLAKACCASPEEKVRK
jgi:hypothetical protein